MKTERRKASALLLCLLASCVLSAACKESATTGANNSATPAASNATASLSPQPTPEPKRDVPPPSSAEARATLERVYKKAVVFEEGRADSFAAGDFNGDGSTDLAAIVKPSGDALNEINSEFANWILADPRSAVPFDPDRPKQAPTPGKGPPRVEARDALLAIVHGHGAEGWRSPEATQSYLLKGVAAQGMRAFAVKDFPPALVVRRSLNARADILSGKLAGVDGFLYWSRGKYVWHERNSK